MVSPVPSREPEPHAPEPHDPQQPLEDDAFQELSDLFRDAQSAAERPDDLSTPVPPEVAPPPPVPPPPLEPTYDEAPYEETAYEEPFVEPPGPAASSVAEVTEAIFAESAALAMNEIAERLDTIERAVADRLDAVDRRAAQRLATLDQAAQGMQIPEEVRAGLAKLAEMGQLASRVDGAESRIRANAERTIEALRNLNARSEGRMEELTARIESLEGSLERLRQGVEAVASYVRRLGQEAHPSSAGGPAPTSEARRVIDRVWREPT